MLQIDNNDVNFEYVDLKSTENCVICLLPMLRGMCFGHQIMREGEIRQNPNIQMPYWHFFHRICLLSWGEEKLRRQEPAKCPTCNSNFDLDSLSTRSIIYPIIKKSIINAGAAAGSAFIGASSTVAIREVLRPEGSSDTSMLLPVGLVAGTLIAMGFATKKIEKLAATALVGAVAALVAEKGGKALAIGVTAFATTGLSLTKNMMTIEVAIGIVAAVAMAEMGGGLSKAGIMAMAAAAVSGVARVLLIEFMQSRERQGL